jgi:hypothetical protein
MTDKWRPAMGTLQSWWRKLTGEAPEAPANIPKPVPRKAPPTEGLELADVPKTREPGNVGAAGFDPYSSDAGYSKPHSWERVDHD